MNRPLAVKAVRTAAHLVALAAVTVRIATGAIGEEAKSEEVAFRAAFVKIVPGTFTMGSKAGEKNERPVHLVTLNREFEMQETEVPQAQSESIIGTNPSQFRGANRPVETLSWHDVQEFIRRLNTRGDGYRYRLPTEAEWEYVCRAGTTLELAGELGEMGYYDKNSGLSTQSVRAKRPNAWGLYDMHGNVWEWVHDWYDNYPRKQILNPAGPLQGSLRVVRGCGWHTTAEEQARKTKGRATTCRVRRAE